MTTQQPVSGWAVGCRYAGAIPALFRVLFLCYASFIHALFLRYSCFTLALFRCYSGFIPLVIPSAPPPSGSRALSRVSVHKKNHQVCCTGRDLKKAGPSDRHPDPRTIPSRHSHAKISCPLFVLISRQAQPSTSSRRCSPCALLSSRKAFTRAPCDREVRSYRSREHLRARP